MTQLPWAWAATNGTAGVPLGITALLPSERQGHVRGHGTVALCHERRLATRAGVAANLASRARFGDAGLGGQRPAAWQQWSHSAVHPLVLCFFLFVN